MAIKKRMIPPHNEAVAPSAKEEGFSEVTLYKWRKEDRTNGAATNGVAKTSF